MNKSIIDDEYEKISLFMIKNDCEVLRDIALACKNPIISLSLLPYHALFCTEAEAFLKNYNMSNFSFDDAPFDIKRMRVRLKQFWENRNSLMKREVLSLDTIQDDLFGSRLSNDFVSDHNLYYNLGIYFDQNNSVIGNTQLYSSFFTKNKSVEPYVDKDEVINFGACIGKYYAYMARKLDITNKKSVLIDLDARFTLRYIDINTNVDDIFGLTDGSSIQKETQLLLLHALSSVNFALIMVFNVIRANIYSIRIMYISMYYAMSVLNSIRKIDPNQMIQGIIGECLDSLINLNSSDFRSCMMHYSFYNNNVCLIKEDYYNIEVPFCGLVESCFDGRNAQSLRNDVIYNLDKISKTISELLVIDISCLNAL